MKHSVMGILLGALVVTSFLSLRFWHTQKIIAESSEAEQSTVVYEIKTTIVRSLINIETWNNLQGAKDDEQREKDINEEALRADAGKVQQQIDAVDQTEPYVSEVQSFAKNLQTWIDAEQNQRVQTYASLRSECEEVLRLLR